MKRNVKQSLWNVGKLAVAGATVFGIALTISVGDPEDGVKTADADIGSWVSTRTLFDGDYGRTMEESGMKPRAYELNGNQVFFAVGYVPQDPQEVLEYYQEQFVAAGINKQKFLEVPEEKFHRTLADITAKPIELSKDELAYNEAMLGGGVVPITQRMGYVAMGGMIHKERLADVEELVDDWQKHDSRNMFRQMDGFRFLDAQQFPGQKGSRVTSVWADENFDAEKMANPGKNAGPPVLTTPACMGCTVSSQMKSLDPSERFRIGHFASQRSPQDLRRFYQTAMPRKGFQVGDAHKAVELARQYLGSDVPLGSVLQFTQDGEESLVAIFRDPGSDETAVFVVESY